MTLWASYTRLLGNRPLTKLLLGEFVSEIGDWIYLVAVVVFVYRETGDPVVLGIVGAARMAPYFLLSIPAGMITDRVDRRMVLLASDLGRGVCMVALAALVSAGAGVWPFAIVTLLATSFSAFFAPGLMALMPSLVRDEAEFGPANSAWATLSNLARFIGPGLAGVLFIGGSLEFAFLVNAATFGLMAVVLWTLPRSPAGTARIPQPGVLGHLEPDLAPTRRWLGRRVPATIDVSAVTGVVFLDSAAWLTFGGINILLVMLAVDQFHAGDEATGFLSGAIGIGGTIGALLSTALVLRPRLGPVMLLAGATFGAAAILVGVAPVLSVGLFAVAVASVGHLVLDVARMTIFQRVVPDAYRGRLMGVLMTFSTASDSAGTLVIPMLVGGFGFAAVLGVLGVFLFGATLLAIALIGRAADIAPGEWDTELRRIARLPIFGGLPVAKVEAALRRLEPIQVEEGAVIIRQGDPADRFYVVGGGTFDVSVLDEVRGSSRSVRTLGRDDVFGERGIIGRRSRTATVRALGPGLLFAMDASSFLALVTRRRGAPERFLALYGDLGEPGTGPNALPRTS